MTIAETHEDIQEEDSTSLLAQIKNIEDKKPPKRQADTY
jgi:hypothetical protein